MANIKIPLDNNLLSLFPDAKNISILPRKKKKKLKKVISKKIADFLIEIIKNENY